MAVPNPYPQVRTVVRFIVNGYEVINYNAFQPEGDIATLHHAPNLAEVLAWIDSNFSGVPYVPPTPTGPFVAALQAAKAVDPLQNQVAEVGATAQGAYIVRRHVHPLTPSRPPLDEFCPDLAAVLAVLTAIFTPPPLEAGGEFTLTPSIISGGTQATIAVGGGPATAAEVYRIIITTQKGQSAYNVATVPGWQAHDVANAITSAINGDASGNVWAQLGTAQVTLFPRDQSNDNIVAIQAGLAGAGLALVVQPLPI